jgi:nicotinic acid mononucleotide adenylyltransferase
MLGSFKDYVSTGADIALVPGSYKPPHKGHYQMVSIYSGMASDVVVLISAPSEKSVRKTKTGQVITPEMSKKIFELYTSNLPNVTVEISNMPSPVGAAYQALESLNGKRVILGASKKDNDWKRWGGAKKWAHSKNLNVDILDPELTAVDILNKPNGTPYSASNIRNNIDKPEMFIDDIPEHVDPQQVVDIINT